MVEAVVAGTEAEGEALSSEIGRGIFFQPVLEADLERAGEIAKLIEAETSDRTPTGTSALSGESMIAHSTEIFAAGITIFGRGTPRQVAVVLATEQPHPERYRP